LPHETQSFASAPAPAALQRTRAMPHRFAIMTRRSVIAFRCPARVDISASPVRPRGNGRTSLRVGPPLGGRRSPTDEGAESIRRRGDCDCVFWPKTSPRAKQVDPGWKASVTSKLAAYFAAWMRRSSVLFVSCKTCLM
jgi:hypothetical protein